MREIAAWVCGGHSRIRNSLHGVSAHSAPRHVSKLSTSTRDAELHECQHIFSQYLRTTALSVSCMHNATVQRNESMGRCVHEDANGQCMKGARHRRA
jgi:hypothetical protein